MECGTPAGTAPAENKDAKPAGSAPNAPTRQEEAKKPPANEQQMSGISERGLFSTIRELGWEEQGAHDIIFDIIDRHDSAAMEAMSQDDILRAIYSGLECIDKNVEDKDGPKPFSLTPLHAAALVGNVRMADILIKNYAGI
ncbi:MAG: hypothetical protein PHF61_07390, partial [Bacteroidales bacterium]|nr:hypothetical protein [Bacteroidales bacterium]